MSALDVDIDFSLGERARRRAELRTAAAGRSPDRAERSRSARGYAEGPSARAERLRPVRAATERPRPARAATERPPARSSEFIDEPPVRRIGPDGIERRTVTIQGRGAERYRPSVDRRPAQRAHERSGFRPDRAAMWAVMLGVLMILAAATSSHAAVVRAARPQHARVARTAGPHARAAHASTSARGALR